MNNTLKSIKDTEEKIMTLEKTIRELRDKYNCFYYYYLSDDLKFKRESCIVDYSLLKNKTKVDDFYIDFADVIFIVDLSDLEFNKILESFKICFNVNKLTLSECDSITSNTSIETFLKIIFYTIRKDAWNTTSDLFKDIVNRRLKISFISIKKTK